MTRFSFYCAVALIATVGLSANAFAKDHYQGHGQYHADRQVRHDDHSRNFRDHDRDHYRSERREHERREWEAHRRYDRDRLRDQREHREWARHHRHQGNRYGWDKGKNNPHQDANWNHAPASGTRPVRPVATNYGNRPVRDGR